MTKEPETGDPATRPEGVPERPPVEAGTSKIGIACVGFLILFVVGIIAVAAMASSG